MAIYMLSAKIIGRSSGGNAVAAAAYRSGEKLEGERYELDEDGKALRTAETFDYTRKGGVVESLILAPEGAPEWTRDRATLWHTVETTERRKDSQLAREMIVSLPRELTLKASAELVRDFVSRELVSRGMIADVSIHNPMASDGKSNPHAHILLTMRDLSEDGSGFDKKRRDWNAAFGNTKGQGSKGGVTASEGLQALRERWAQALNGKLAQAGVTERVSHLSNEAQGIDREPQPKMGKHWHGSTELAPKVAQLRDEIRIENSKRRYLASPVSAKRRSQATTIAQNYALDWELLNGLYGGQTAEPPRHEWQAHASPLEQGREIEQGGDW